MSGHAPNFRAPSPSSTPIVPPAFTGRMDFAQIRLDFLRPLQRLELSLGAHALRYHLMAGPNSGRHRGLVEGIYLANPAVIAAELNCGKDDVVDALRELEGSGLVVADAEGGAYALPHAVQPPSNADHLLGLLKRIASGRASPLPTGPARDAFVCALFDAARVQARSWGERSVAELEQHAHDYSSSLDLDLSPEGIEQFWARRPQSVHTCGGTRSRV